MSFEFDEFLKRLKAETSPSPLHEKHKPVLFIIEFWEVTDRTWKSPLEIYDIHSVKNSILYRRNGVIEHHHTFSPYDMWVIEESSSRILQGAKTPLIRIKYRGGR